MLTLFSVIIGLSIGISPLGRTTLIMLFVLITTGG